MLVLINLPCYALFILVQRFFSSRRRRRVVVGVVGSGRAVFDGFFKSSV